MSLTVIPEKYKKDYNVFFRNRDFQRWGYFRFNQYQIFILLDYVAVVKRMVTTDKVATFVLAELYFFKRHTQ